MTIAVTGGDDPPRPVESEGQTLAVNMLGSSGRYTLGRYVNGDPEPVGPIAESACDLWSPSLIRARGRYWLYAAENDCREWQRLVLFSSDDGVRFERIGAAIRRRPGEGQLRMPYVVFDGGLFRAWYTIDEGERQGQQLVYAESRDGLRFRRLAGPRARAGPGRLDSGAITVEMVFRDPSSGTWNLLYTGYDPALERARPALMTFANPRQRRYAKRGAIGQIRDRRGDLLAPAAAGARELRAGGGPFRRGDPIVIAAGSDPEPARIIAVDGEVLTLDGPLRLDHEAGEPLALADASKISPSYVCRDGRRWRGLFTLFGAPPRLNGEYTAVVSAEALSGPWTLDRAARFPALSPANGELKRSVENPTPVTEGPDLQACGRRIPGRLGH